MTSDTDDIAQRGMSLFQFQIRDALHWIVRDQPVSDYGIDAHIELKDGDVATGRLLAFQVKSSTNGRTGYFDEPRNEGWTYRPTDRHVKYWLAHSLPVFVALIDLETRSIYWRAIDSTNLSRSRRGGWKVHVPNHNTLTNARTQWELAADRLYHDAHLRFIDHIEVLPPTASEILVEMRSSGDTSASDLLAAHLAVGRREPALVLETLLQNSPNWMNEVGAAWKTVGAYADAHQLPESAAEGYLRASRLLPSERAMLKNWAAFELIQVQRVQALSLFDEAARENGGLLSELGRAICLSFDSSRSDLDLGDPTLQARLELADEDEGFIIATFLAAQAASQNHWNRSVDLLRRVRERRPWSATLLSRLSFTLALRAQSEQSQAGDIAEATEVAQLAVSNYRKWNGPTTEILAHLLGLLANAREWEQILRSATAAPTGQATDTEAARPFVMSMAATAAHELGEESLRDSLLNSLPDGPDKAFEAAKRITEGLNPKLPEAIEQWESVLGALDDARPVQILHAVSMLAHGGVDRSERLIPLTESGAIAARERDLAAAIALFHSDPSQALPRLRVLADSTPRAAKALCMLLADQHGRAQEAIQTCKNAADRFQDPVFRLMEVDLLLAEGDTGSAKDAAELALSSPGISAVHAAAAHHFLAQIAGGDEDWPGVIRHTSAAVSSRRRAEHDEVWWLITAHLRQDRDDLAFETVRRFRPMPTNRIQVRLWLRAVHYGDFDPEIASQIVQLAIQFENDTELAAALLTEILLGTRDEAATEGANPLDSRSPVPMSTRQQAFAALARHTELHGANSPIRVISIPEDAEGIVETLSQFLRAGNRRSSASAVEEIRRSNVPLGLLSEITGHTYAFTLARRDLGMYFSCFASGADADADADAAAAASASSRECRRRRLGAFGRQSTWEP